MSKTVVAVSLGLAALLACEGALAHGRGRSGSSGGWHKPSASHRHTRTFFGAGVLAAPVWPTWFYAPYLSAPAPVYYIEQADPLPAGGEWFYCPASGAYFPDAPECPEGWQRVPATPVPAPQ